LQARKRRKPEPVDCSRADFAGSNLTGCGMAKWEKPEFQENRPTNYIKQLIAGGENQHLDFKFEISDSRKIARTLSAFANTGGGVLLVGVKDNGRIAGIRSDEEFYMLEAAAQLYCKPEISFSVKEWNIEGKTILEAKIPKSGSPPHYARAENGKWLAYVRVDDENMLANNIMIKVWKRRISRTGTLIRYSDKEKILFSYLKEHETITLSMFQRLAGVNTYKATTILVNLIMLDLISVVFRDKKIVYTLGNRQEDP
jgi:predicted HTH transcriptional regulator